VNTESQKAFRRLKTTQPSVMASYYLFFQLDSLRNKLVKRANKVPTARPMNTPRSPFPSHPPPPSRIQTYDRSAHFLSHVLRNKPFIPSYQRRVSETINPVDRAEKIFLKRKRKEATGNNSSTPDSSHT